MTAFETRDLHGMDMARCTECRFYRFGSDYLADETRCRSCDGGRYDATLHAAAAATEAGRPPEVNDRDYPYPDPGGTWIDDEPLHAPEPEQLPVCS